VSEVPRATIVVAIEDSAANLPAILANLRPLAHPDCEFLFFAAEQAALSGLPSGLPNLRALRCASGARIPEMWRDGIVAARSEWVALLTAHAVPTPQWLAALLDHAPPGDVAGVGGYFSNDEQASPLDWAIYLLRYAAFSRPVSREATHIAADNAVYRRSEVLACTDLVTRGFWEVEYHVRFLDKGLRLCLSADLQVIHVNRYTRRGFAAQRRGHGFAFGRDRARRLGFAQLVLHALAAPLVPALLYAKVLARVRRHGWLAATPIAAYAWLFYFVLHWAWGEARGVFSDIIRRITCQPWLQRR
jgi:hypothetical protein